MYEKPMRNVLAELRTDEWEQLCRLADEDDRTIVQMASRLLRRALREALKSSGEAANAA